MAASRRIRRRWSEGDPRRTAGERVDTQGRKQAGDEDHQPDATDQDAHAQLAVVHLHEAEEREQGAERDDAPLEDIEGVVDRVVDELRRLQQAICQPAVVECWDDGWLSGGCRHGPRHRDDDDQHRQCQQPLTSSPAKAPRS